MPVTWKIQSATMRFNATGHYSFGEVVDALQQALLEGEQESPRNILLDLSRSCETRSADELRSLAELLAVTPGFAGTCAVVVPSGHGLHFGLARMLHAFAEPLGVRVGVFETDAEAREFAAPPGVERSSPS